MTALTISEKILSAKAGRDVSAGDVVVCNVDRVIGTDASSPMAIDYFERMGGDPTVRSGARRSLPSTTTPRQLRTRRDRSISESELSRTRTAPSSTTSARGSAFSSRRSRGACCPATSSIGADSHTVTCGALNLFATGLGSSDLAAAMITGQVWLRVPESIKVTLTGSLREGVAAKDLALALVGRARDGWRELPTLEFHGPGVAALTLEDRLVVSNLGVEMDAKAAIFPGGRRH